MTTISIAQDEGRLSPKEAEDSAKASQIDAPNLAGDETIGPSAAKFLQGIVAEWSDRMRPLFRRWRATTYMLQGNTLDRSGPEDVHCPELYKTIETLKPRIEEAILERDPWFDVRPRRRQSKAKSAVVASYMDWLFDQARVRNTVQPAAYNQLVHQAGVWYAWWDSKVQRVTAREEQKEWKKGRLHRSVKKTVRDEVTFFGPRVSLVDPFDFIIDTKATNAQDAVYVGHRAWVTIEEIRRLGKQFGWINLGEELDNISGSRSEMSTSHYSWPRDPTNIGMMEEFQRTQDGRPGKVELMMLYSRYDPKGNGDYRDYQFVMSGGKLVHEVRINQHDNEMRPYAIARSSNNGHSFYGIGPLDNAVRLNQQLDRHHQIFLRAAELAAIPIGFAEEDSDIPDSLYKMQPGTLLKGVGPIRFTQVPEGILSAAPLVLNTLTRNIEETVGAFKIQMGQDLAGSTATEATLSLQEGNRRTRGLIRGMAEGLGQLLEIFYKMARQHSIADVEFPVLGKRAAMLKRDYASVNPADLLDDVQFDLVGLHSLRTNGLKATGLQIAANSMAPFIVANPQAVDQVRMLHSFFEEHVGKEEADQIIRVPTPIDQLMSQQEENEGLITGTEIEVDDDDDHRQHLEEIEELYQRALHDPKMPWDVKRVIVQHRMGHLYLLQRQQAQQAAMAKRSPQQAELPPEAGGQQGETGQSPMAGGMSAQMTQLGQTPGGQTQGETPGPLSAAKQPRAGRAKRPVSQTANTMQANA